MSKEIRSYTSQVHQKCPVCGTVNKHEWGDKIPLKTGYFVVKCECETTYQQVIIEP